MSAFVVINPKSGGGRTGREWPNIARALESVYPGLTAAMTTRRGDAAKLVRDALCEGRHEIVAVGGDGTINEAVNGMFRAGVPVSPDAVLGFVTSGTGGDLRKSFGIGADYASAIARLKAARPRPVDIGRITCVTAGGGTAVRHFINVASVGLSGEIVAAVNRARIAKLFGGKFAFAFHSVLAMLTYRARAVRLRVDRSYDEIATISTMAIANGQFFGGGMRIAPHAVPDDGHFDIVVIGGTPKRRALVDMNQIYRGTHLDNPAVRHLRGTKIMAAPVAETKGRPVRVEADGESAGQLPATFEILPRALKLRC